jgi:acyl-CoA synthetase (NDP forming)
VLQRKWFLVDYDLAVISKRAEEGQEFVLRAGQCPKPVVVLKTGETSVGVKAVSNHMTSEEAVHMAEALRRHQPC